MLCHNASVCIVFVCGIDVHSLCVCGYSVGSRFCSEDSDASVGQGTAIQPQVSVGSCPLVAGLSCLAQLWNALQHVASWSVSQGHKLDFLPQSFPLFPPLFSPQPFPLFLPQSLSLSPSPPFHQAFGVHDLPDRQNALHEAGHGSGMVGPLSQHNPLDATSNDHFLLAGSSILTLSTMASNQRTSVPASQLHAAVLIMRRSSHGRHISAMAVVVFSAGLWHSYLL